jgi:hypothetical protein
MTPRQSDYFPHDAYPRKGRPEVVWTVDRYLRNAWNFHVPYAGTRGYVRTRQLKLYESKAVAGHVSCAAPAIAGPGHRFAASVKAGLSPQSHRATHKTFRRIDGQVARGECAHPQRVRGSA